MKFSQLVLKERVEKGSENLCWYHTVQMLTFGSVNVLHLLNATVFDLKPREEWRLGSTLHGSPGVVINIQHQGLRVAWKVDAFLGLDLA